SSQNGTIRTLQSSNTVDSRDYAVSIVANDQVGISASVAPRPADLQVEITVPYHSDNFYQDLVAEFHIKYGSFLSNPTELTIEANWGLGTIEGATSGSVELMEYLFGSASPAFNGTPPVIDLVNNKIRWHILNFPANTINQIVSFKLKTKKAYIGTKLVNFNIIARASTPTSSSFDSTLNRYYKYAPPSATGPTSTPTPTPQVTTTTTPTPTPSKSLIKELSITSVSYNSAKILIRSEEDAVFGLRYGLSPGSQPIALKSSGFSRQKEFALQNLNENTIYYVRVAALNSFRTSHSHSQK
ncbi:hypothetical protein HYT32_00315, partial [Candidatus Roizmanbacteria bacterium]|nr:hypothetical protein [Candidatus Roizmanbacteria bacterium]